MILLMHMHNSALCQATWQWLVHNEKNHNKNLLIVDLVHRSKCVESLFHNVFFIKLTMLNICSSWIKPNTWTTIISTNLMYSNSL